MRKSKLKRHLQQNYGQAPDLLYFPGDLNDIRTYFNHRYIEDLDDFLVDDITWNDLDGDTLFKQINQGLSTSGEQYLYYLLRSPSLTKEEYEKRETLITIMEQNPDLRLELQVILAKLGRRKAANTTEAFSPSSHDSSKLSLYLFLVGSLLGSALLSFFYPMALLLLVSLLLFIPIYNHVLTNRIERELETLNYSVSMIYTASIIKKKAFPELEEHLAPLYQTVTRLKSLSRYGHVPTKYSASEIVLVLNGFFLFNLILFEVVKNKLGKYHKEIFEIHEHLGRLDSAIAIASYRKSLEAYAIPQIDFSITDTKHIRGIDLVHPLIDDAIPNDLDTTESILLTGSNASGKSTFLKTVALNAILAQSICTALASRYEANAFRIYSSMAITDNLFAGESYFVAEIKSLRRMADADTAEQPLLCVIDEVLRGTNTIERIAASSELLKYMATEKRLCLAATHDMELCTMLVPPYQLFHFEETVTEGGEILFDYSIKEGPARTRNAIKLMKSLGFDSDMIDRANEKANLFVADGNWKE